MTIWYIIDSRRGEIVNAVEFDMKADAFRVLDHMDDAEHLRLNANPPQAMLERYRYWNERP